MALTHHEELEGLTTGTEKLAIYCERSDDSKDRVHKVYSDSQASLKVIKTMTSTADQPRLREDTRSGRLAGTSLGTGAQRNQGQRGSRQSGRRGTHLPVAKRFIGPTDRQSRANACTGSRGVARDMEGRRQRHTLS